MQQQQYAKIVVVLSGLLALVQLYHGMNLPPEVEQRQLRRTSTTKPVMLLHQCPQSTAARVALCVVVKDEEAYLDEFINYHWALGFDTIYVHDNADNFELAQWGQQKRAALHAVSKTCPGRSPQQLQVQHTPGEGRQMELLESCASTAQTEGHTWAAFFDADEYLVLRERQHIIDYLHATMAEGGSLAIPWVDMTTTTTTTASDPGTAEERRVTYSPVPLTLRYQYRDVEATGKSRHIKTIATLVDVDHTTPRHNPHVVPLRPGAVQRNIWGQVTEGPVERSTTAAPAPGPAALYHYGTKSYKEYYRKRQRGRATVRRNHKSNWELLRQAQQLLREQPTASDRRVVVYDPTAWEHLTRLVPAYAMWNDAAWRTLIVM